MLPTPNWLKGLGKRADSGRAAATSTPLVATGEEESRTPSTGRIPLVRRALAQLVGRGVSRNRTTALQSEGSTTRRAPAQQVQKQRSLNQQRKQDDEPKVEAICEQRAGHKQAACRLSARTSKCALHGPPTSPISAPMASQLQRPEQEAKMAAKTQLRLTAPEVVAASCATSEEKSRAEARGKKQQQKHVPRPTRLKRQRRRQSASQSVASWPLAKQTIANGMSFGDCEDIASPHLGGRIAQVVEPTNGSRQQSDNGFSMSQQSNYNHRRPFASPFERPPTGWIYNAIEAAERIKLNPSKSLRAKMFAANGFRRRSYDDREGDNDINILMQPSDLQDFEKGANSYKSSAYKTATSRFRTMPTTKADLKLASCLLDQDYNQTVRLFIKNSALNWNFNSFTFDAMCCGRSLTELLLHLFDYYDLYNIFNLNMVNVLKCFRLLEFGYHSTNPYHNSIHAADVTQAMHCFIQEEKIRRHMTHLETLCSILAAVCHDLDHPGVNQTFLVATNNPLASLYNNNSVLENHHWRFALCIFKESQLFDHFEDDVFNEMKIQLKHLILATDIARQNEYLKRFKDLTSSCEFSMQNTEDRSLVLQMALKCADLGNPCRPWLISRVWSNLICDEFYKMGQVERRLGIPLTPICQREKTSIAGIQTDFFRFIVLPLLELWHKFLKSPLSSLLMSNFDHNYHRWQRANRIIQQMRRRKSLACLEPVEDDSGCEENDSRLTGNLGPCSRHSFEAIKRASSDYVKSGNGKLESLRNFQLDMIFEKSPLVQTKQF